MLLARLACLPSHPVMNSVNLNLFKASVGETTAFVVVSAVHSRTGLRPGTPSRGCRTACRLFKSPTEAIAPKCQYRLLKQYSGLEEKKKNAD